MLINPPWDRMGAMLWGRCCKILYGKGVGAFWGCGDSSVPSWRSPNAYTSSWTLLNPFRAAPLLPPLHPLHRVGGDNQKNRSPSTDTTLKSTKNLPKQPTSTAFIQPTGPGCVDMEPWAQTPGHHSSMQPWSTREQREVSSWERPLPVPGTLNKAQRPLSLCQPCRSAGV